VAKKSFKKKRKQLLEEFAKENIHQAVLELIGEKGVEDLTVSSVAKRAGIAKGTIYLYFKDKEDLICSTIQTSLDPLFSHINEILESDLRPDKKLVEYATFSMEFLEKYRSTFRALMYNQHQVHVHKEHYTDDKHQQILDRLAKVIKDGVDQGIFREIDPVMGANIFMESTIAVTVQYLITNKKRDIEEDVDSLIDILLNGLNRIKS